MKNRMKPPWWLLCCVVLCCVVLRCVVLCCGQVRCLTYYEPLPWRAAYRLTFYDHFWSVSWMVISFSLKGKRWIDTDGWYFSVFQVHHLWYTILNWIGVTGNTWGICVPSYKINACIQYSIYQVNILLDAWTTSMVGGLSLDITWLNQSEILMVISFSLKGKRRIDTYGWY